MLRRTFAWWVRRSSDKSVARVVARKRPQKMVMKELARLIDPGKDNRFTGEIGYVLVTGKPDGPVDWTVTIDETEVSVRRERAEQPVVRIRTPAVDLTRMLVGQITAREVMLGGRMIVQGQLGMASRIGELFPGPQRSAP